MKLIRMMILALFLLPSAYADDSILIRDMESLRDSLPFKDMGRPPLTRRLADLYFQKAVEDDKNLILTGNGSPAEITKMRDRAGKLYREALDGEKGTYPAIEGELKIKIQFQLARIDRMNGQRSKAIETFQTITSSQIAGKQLMRETLLTIAEMNDEDGKWEKAQEAYQKALPLCEGPEAISYVRYRLSWAHFRKGDIQTAQNEISQALYDAQGNPKDQVIADYIQFLAADTKTDGKPALLKIEALAQKSRRPMLIDDLGNAFFAIGNRQAGVNVIAHAHRLKPDPFYAARLAEEYYGFRQWDDVTTSLNSLQSLSAKIPSLEAKRKEAVDQILRRLVVQIDGERKSNPGKFDTESRQAIDVYLTAFPESEIKQKMREGWLSAQPDEVAKMERLALWEMADKGQPTERRWRQDRAALALKLKNYKVIREEAAELAKSNDEAVAREWTYVGAKAALDAGEENVALETFKVLARKTVNTDKWAVQSQHLSLDILNRQKKFAELAAQAALWTNVSGLKTSSHSQDVAQMESARQEALFEDAASKGETPAALALFMQYCQEGLFKEKSCPNAKVLAIKLHQQTELVKVLKIQNDQEALSSEYERMGRFVEAAKIQEASLKSSDPEMSWFKVSLLYRIGGDEASRMRVLRTLATRLQKQGKMTEEVEAMSKATFLKSSMTPSELIRLPWSASTKIKLAAQFENEGRGDAVTHKMVLSSKEDLGPVWAQNVINRVSVFDKKQRSVGFYGRNSRANFQLRLKLLAKFADETKTVLPGASTQVRAYLLDQVAKAYSDIDKEILSSPIPEGLEADQVAQVNEAMESLASPLRAEGESYMKLRDEQLSTLTDKEVWVNHIAQGPEAFMTALKEVTSQPETKTASGIAPELRKSILDKLSQNPNDRSALESLRDDYSARGESAPAAYFTGRLAEMEKL